MQTYSDQPIDVYSVVDRQTLIYDPSVNKWVNKFHIDLNINLHEVTEGDIIRIDQNVCTNVPFNATCVEDLTVPTSVEN